MNIIRNTEFGGERPLFESHDLGNPQRVDDLYFRRCSGCPERQTSAALQPAQSGGSRVDAR